jgi:Immunity protein Imm1
MTARTFINFGKFHGNQLPPLNELEQYFTLKRGYLWLDLPGVDTAGIEYLDVTGSGEESIEASRVDLALTLWGHPAYGVYLQYDRRAKNDRMTRCSVGSGESGQWIRSRQGDLIPLGLCISFDNAWRAVKEFVETGGALPESVDWLAANKLAPNAFPDPNYVPRADETIFDGRR